MNRDNRNKSDNSGRSQNQRENENRTPQDLENRSSVRNDLPDSPEDRRKLESENTTMDLPDVKDIPGQEHVIAPTLGELGDTTVASADEEGDRVFENASDRNDTDRRGEVTPEERHALDRTDYMPTTDEDQLQRASMDNVDYEGEPLNEAGFGEGMGDTVAPDDLDTNTAAGDESRRSSMGQGDEENKTYSLGSADNDNMNEGTP